MMWYPSAGQDHESIQAQLWEDVSKLVEAFAIAREEERLLSG
jgi:hypothetical protein